MITALLIGPLLFAPPLPQLPVYPGAERMANFDVGVGWRSTYQANVPPNKVANWYRKIWQKPVQTLRGMTVVGLVIEDLRDKDRGIADLIMVKGVEIRPGPTKGQTIFTLVSGRISEGKELKPVDIKIPDILKTLPLDLPLPSGTRP